MSQYSKLDCYVALKELTHLSLTGMEVAIDFQSLVPSFWTKALSLSSCKQSNQHLFHPPNRSDKIKNKKKSCNESAGNHLLLCPFHLHFPTLSLLCHIRIGVLRGDLLFIVPGKQATAWCLIQRTDMSSNLTRQGRYELRRPKLNNRVGFLQPSHLALTLGCDCHRYRGLFLCFDQLLLNCQARQQLPEVTGLGQKNCFFFFNPSKHKRGFKHHGETQV